MGFVTMGVDIGQKHDPTAIAVVEAESRQVAGRLDDYYLVRHLARLPLGTPYPAVAAALKNRYEKVHVRQVDGGFPLIWLDSTGVGQPVVDMMQAARVPVTPVYFTHGDRITTSERGTMSLGKALLVSQLQVLLQSGRILLPSTPEAKALAAELQDYEIHVDERANDTYGAFKTGTHDDLVTALGLAVLAAIHGQRLPYAWLRTDPTFVGQVHGTAPVPVARETPEETRARRMAARGFVMPIEELERPHTYGEPLPSPWTPDRFG